MLFRASPLSYCKLLLLEENRRNLLVVVYALDDVGEDVRYGHHLEFAQVLFRVERYGVRDDHLLQGTGIDFFVSLPRKDRVGDGCPDALGTFFH